MSLLLVVLIGLFVRAKVGRLVVVDMCVYASIMRFVRALVFFLPSIHSPLLTIDLKKQSNRQHRFIEVLFWRMALSFLVSIHFFHSSEKRAEQQRTSIVG